MKRTARALFGLSLMALVSGANVSAQTTKPIPDEFKDPESGARIIHVSRVPNNRSGVIYFTQGTFASDNHRLLFHTQFQDKWRHLYEFDLNDNQVTPLVTDKLSTNQDVASKTNNVYYLADHAVWCVNIDSRQSRKIADLPREWGLGAGITFNSDESIIAGVTEIGGPDDWDTGESAAPMASGTASKPVAVETKRLKAMGNTFEAHRENLLYTIDAKSGKITIRHRINTWLGHIQFSPTDPNLIMFCHEGPWEQVDRIWTLRVGETDPKLFYKRTEPHEIVGHEFWGADGKTIWFQQTFRDLKKSYLTGEDVQSGKLTQYIDTPETNAIHQTASADGTFFIGDGTGKVKSGPGRYLTLEVPDGNSLKSTRLCSLLANDYTQCEPNPHISADNHWVAFTASFSGTPQAWAMELPQSLWKK